MFLYITHGRLFPTACSMHLGGSSPCELCCFSSSLEPKVLLQKSQENWAETPGVDSSDLEPPKEVPPPCISCLFGTQAEQIPCGAITPDE